MFYLDMLKVVYFLQVFLTGFRGPKACGACFFSVVMSKYDFGLADMRHRTRRPLRCQVRGLIQVESFVQMCCELFIFIMCI